MTAFTLSANRNFDELVTKTGADTYALAGYRLTIDGDTRYDLNCTATTGSAASFATSATLGGELFIDGSNVWLIPFDGGSGSLPARGTAITQAGVTGKLIGVWTAINAAPVADLGAMPATGWIKVKQVSGTYASGALGGLTANATGAAVRGWIEVCADASGTVTITRLGKLRVLGDFFALGTTSGSAHQVMALPTSGGANFWVPYVEVADGAGGWEMWPCLNAGTGGGWSTAALGTDARAKFCQCDGTQIRFGGDGTNLIGAIPTASRAVRIPNVFLQSNTTADRTTTVRPNTDPTIRFETATTGAGVIDLENVSCCWYLNMSQAYSLRMVHVGYADAMIVSEIATALNLSWVCAGLTQGIDVAAAAFTSCFAGGTITDCSFGRGGSIGSADNSVNITYCIGQTFTRVFTWQGTLRTNAGAYGRNVSTCADLTFTDCKTVGPVAIVTSQRVTDTGLVYWDRLIGTTVSATATNAYAWTLSAGCSAIVLSGLTYGGVDNVGPYNGILSVTACSNVKLRSIGTAAAPFNLGTTAASRPGVIVLHGGNSNGIRVQRVYTYNTRSGVTVGVNSDKNVIYEHVWGDYADTLDAQNLNMIVKGGRLGSGTPTSSFTSVYGTHFWDAFISDTAGRLGFFFNEPTAETAAQVTLSGTAAFTSTGSIFLPAVNDSITLEWPHFVLGHTRFANSAVICTGGTTVSSRMNFYFSVDTGTGWSSWSSAYTNLTTLGTDLYNLGAFSATTGIKLRIKIEANSASANNTINVFYVTTVTDTTSMQTAYPLDVATLAFTGLQAGSEVRCYTGTEPGTTIGGVESSGTTFSFTHAAGGLAGYIQIISLGYQAFYLPITYSSSDQSIPVTQVLDRNYQD